MAQVKRAFHPSQRENDRSIITSHLSPGQLIDILLRLCFLSKYKISRFFASLSLLYLGCQRGEKTSLSKSRFMRGIMRRLCISTHELMINDPSPQQTRKRLFIMKLHCFREN